jgi:Skp family chaperone for outer membrane proteins
MKTTSLLITGLFLPLFLSAQTTRMVTVDFQKVFEEYTELQAMDQKMKMEIQAFREDQQVKLQALQKKNQTFQALREQAASETLSVEEREVAVEKAQVVFQELQEERQAIQQEQQAYNQDLEARMSRLRQDVVNQVTAHIQELSRERSWDLVVDISARGNTGLKVVLFSDDSLDVTLDVIRTLNQAAAEKAAGEGE